MGEQIKPDKRRRQVKERLLKAMIDLAEEKDWSRVTVSDLIGRSHVARASFYRNFQTIGDLIDYGIDQFHADFWENAPGEPQDFLTEEMLAYTFGFYYAKRRLFLCLSHAAVPLDILGVITENMVLSFGDMPSGSIERYRLYYYAGALYNMTVRWLEDGARETPEEMAREFLACCNAVPLAQRGSGAATG